MENSVAPEDGGFHRQENVRHFLLIQGLPACTADFMFVSKIQEAFSAVTFPA
jgi:hypothetical protein